MSFHPVSSNSKNERKHPFFVCFFIRGNYHSFSSICISCRMDLLILCVEISFYFEGIQFPSWRHIDYHCFRSVTTKSKLLILFLILILVYFNILWSVLMFKNLPVAALVKTIISPATKDTLTWYECYQLLFYWYVFY